MALEVAILKKLEGFTLDVSFTAEPGVTALLGASGSGKSMTLRCIAGVEKPDAGRIALDGRVLYDSERKIDLPPQQRRVGYLFQRYALFPNMTVLQNIEAGLSLEHEKSVRRQKRESLIHRFHLEGLELRYPRELSGGQMQRAALCRMLAGEPEAILLDEPFAALDSFLRWQLEREVRTTLGEFPGVALLVSHDRGEVYRMSERVCVLGEGKNEQVTGTRALFEHPGTLRSAMISGCKNVADAELDGDSTVFVPDWNARLHCDPADGRAVRYVGVRAHYIVPCEKGAENALLCRVEDAAEDVFTSVLTLRPEGAPATLRVELEKDAAKPFPVGTQAYFSLPKAAVMLLSDSE
ncbi:MAG TPA: ATP-binding cassette domain-containing protein [Feifaniaceae bacterium]|nr:ATP-binding cassette domain-containing protein [Feifaniaceae bacterium]